MQLIRPHCINNNNSSITYFTSVDHDAVNHGISDTHCVGAKQHSCILQGCNCCSSCPVCCFIRYVKDNCWMLESIGDVASIGQIWMGVFTHIMMAMPDTFEIVPDDSYTSDVAYSMEKQHARARRLLLPLLVVELGASWPPECQPWLDLTTRCRH